MIDKSAQYWLGIDKNREIIIGISYWFLIKFKYCLNQIYNIRVQLKMIIKHCFATHKILMMSGLTLSMLYGCATTNNVGTNVVKDLQSPQEVISQKGLNASNGRAREYVYDWGTQAGSKATEVSSPKNYMNSYCQMKEGQFSLLQSSKMSLMQDAAAKRRLEKDSVVQQSIGAYRCTQKNGQSWIVSIEPMSERKRSNNSDVRVVALLTKIVTENELKKQSNSIVAPVQEKGSTTKVTTAVVAKPAAVKVETKVEAKVEEEAVKQPEKIVETIQQQQNRLYLGARRDLNRGANQLNACNQAERAYNLGRFYNSSGPNIYTESGILVAKCLTTVPAYSKKFANPKGRAKSILQEIVNNQNHSVAKHMLQQLK